MKQSRILNYLLGTTSKVEILRVLFESDDAMTGRRIAATAGISPRSCQLSLDSLVKNKALFRKAVGRAYSYTLNREHKVVWELLRPIFEQERLVHREIAKIVQHGTRAHVGLVAIWYKLVPSRKSEAVNYLLLVEEKKGFPTKEVATLVDEAITMRFGCQVKGEIADLNDLASKHLATISARERFEREWTKLKGPSVNELLDASAKKNAAKKIRGETALEME
ncbi:MAG: hypothetical protein C4523_09905 [Myxococcales bacterium]|nr:MAG: hypothetical protein C4523_09905 [Myxococcales bacterium]